MKRKRIAVLLAIVLLLMAGCATDKDENGCRKATLCWRDEPGWSVTVYERPGWVDCRKGYTPDHLSICTD